MIWPCAAIMYAAVRALVVAMKANRA